VSSVLFLIFKNISDSSYKVFHDYYASYIKDNFTNDNNDLLYVINNLMVGEYLHKYQIAEETNPAILYNILNKYYKNNNI
jgi:hypothetical protein